MVLLRRFQFEKWFCVKSYGISYSILEHHACTVIEMASEVAGMFKLTFFLYQFMNLIFFNFSKEGEVGYWRRALVSWKKYGACT